VVGCVEFAGVSTSDPIRATMCELLFVRMRQLSILLTASVLFSCAIPAQSFSNFESGPVQSVRVSADGSRLFVVDTVGGNLSVFDLGNAIAPALLAEIPVGLDPVSVMPRTRDEVWVVNLVSDSISIVDVAERRVVDTLRVKDEPSDVVFAGGKAFVSAATTDTVHVFDAVTHAEVGTIPVFGKDPRSLAVSPDGAHVYAVIQRSGNGTTVVPEFLAPLPPSPTNPLLPTAPNQSILVRADDPAWSVANPFTLPDNDIAEIDSATLQVTRYFPNVGTTNTGIAVHPVSGDLWVANTEARNLVRFETALRGHAIDSRLTRITTGPSPVITPFDLNPGVNYNQLPNPGALTNALAEPFGVTIEASTGLVYTAAQGTDRIGVCDLAGNVIARIEIGNTPGTAVNTRRKRGPRALALHPAQNVLYVHNHLSDTLSVVDTVSRAVLAELPISTWDPMPGTLREGRRFLYDAKLSGNGTMSCAACHIDGDTDGIAWDLGDPTGSMASAPSQPFPFNLGITQFHPMKGPMTTQTLRGLQGGDPLHWRGDRANFQTFNGAFASLLGGAVIATQDMNDYAAFATSIAMPGNPNQQLDRTYRTSPAGNNEAAGFVAFQAQVANLPLVGAASCTTCHALPTGSNRRIVGGLILNEPQQMKVPQLRSLYRKVGFNRVPGAQKSGFGYTHDGAIDNLTTFLAIQQFSTWPVAAMDDIATFLLSFDTGTAPAVGLQVTVTAANGNTAAVQNDLSLLAARSLAGDFDVVAHGKLDGRIAGLLYTPVTGLWTVDRTGEGPYSTAQLQAKVLAGTARLTLSAVMPGTGTRLGLDRDLDGSRNGDEAALAYGTATAGCLGEPRLLGNSEPRVGNGLFAYAMDHAPASGGGFVLLGLAQALLPIAGISVLVDPNVAVAQFVLSDTHGEAVQRFEMPADPVFAGLSVFAQVGWLDACGPQGLSASRGLALTIRP
jgi:YVTN family beta-propeller protein